MYYLLVHVFLYNKIFSLEMILYSILPYNTKFRGGDFFVVILNV